MASVYLRGRTGIRDGAEHVRTRWPVIRRRLRDEGAPEPILAALDECTHQAPLRGQAMAAFADADGRSHVEHLPRSVEEGATLGPFPHLSPLLAARHREVPVVVVVTDRRGADLLLVEPGAPDLVCQVVGEDLLVGGSAPVSPHRRLARAEQQWTADARAVSEALTWLVGCSRARLVVTGGQAGTLDLLRTRLEPRIRALLVGVRGPSDPGSLAARARLMAADVAALEEAAVVEELLAALPGGRACVGATATLRAVVHGQAEEVLVAPEQADRHGIQRLVLDSVGAAGRPVRLSDVLVHAACATSTTVRTVRDGRRLPAGVGALLRDSLDVPRTLRKRVLS
ncbi:baeRF2 domain-containing protein [Geodermatophilus sp. SYSU D00696]